MTEKMYKNGQFVDSPPGLNPVLQSIPDGAKLMQRARDNIRGGSYGQFVNNRETVLRVVNNDTRMLEILSGFGIQLVPEKPFSNYLKDFVKLFDACQVYIERYGDAYQLANFFRYVIDSGKVGVSFAGALSNTNNLVVTTGVMNVVTKAVTIANKIASFVKGKTQKHVLDEVSTLDGYILTRFSLVLSRNEIYDNIIDPWKRQFKLFSGDIPNVKIGGNYNKEMARVAQYYVSYIMLFQPDILPQWEQGVQSGKTVGTALLNANGFQYRKDVVPFPKEVAEKLLFDAGKGAEPETETPAILQAGFGGGMQWVLIIVLVLIVGGMFLKKS